MTVAEYMQRFDELKNRSQIVEDHRHTLARFKSGLRFDIRKELLRQPLDRKLIKLSDLALINPS